MTRQTDNDHNDPAQVTVIDTQMAQDHARDQARGWHLRDLQRLLRDELQHLEESGHVQARKDVIQAALDQCARDADRLVRLWD